MEIKTKYNVGDKVWTMAFEEIFSTDIKEINISVGIEKYSQEEEIQLRYRVNCRIDVREDQIFSTKEELLEAVVDNGDNIIYVAPDCLGGFKEGDVVWKASFNVIHKGKIKVATEEDLAKRKHRYTGEIWGDEECLYRSLEELIEARTV